MNPIVDPVARWIWASMLWFLRRPQIKAWRMRLITGGRKEASKERFIAQERFARRHGLRLIRMVLTVFLISVMATVLYMFGLRAVNEGWLKLPESAKDQGALAPS